MGVGQSVPHALGSRESNPWSENVWDITEAVETDEGFRLNTETVQERFCQTNLVTKRSLHPAPRRDRSLGRSTRIFESEPATYLERVHPGDRETVRNALQREPCRLIYRIVRPDAWKAESSRQTVALARSRNGFWKSRGP